MDDFLLFLPETVVVVAALIAMVMSAMNVAYRATWYASLVLAGLACAATVACQGMDGEPFFAGIYAVDGFSQVLKLGIAAGLLLTLLASGQPGSVRESTRIDLPLFLFISAAGMMMLVSATELLTLYVALELSAYGLYIMAALGRARREGSEAAAKYILFGAASSAVSLYGISLIFGATRTTYLSGIVEFAAGLPIDAASAAGDATLLLVGVLLVLANLLFKLGAFPFHAWAPDAYQGAPHQAATFIATVSKVAAVGVLVRVLAIVAPYPGELDGRLPGHLSDVLVVLCVLSMTVGNLAALAQRDLKRLLGYSTVAHAGYIMMGLLAFSQTGTAAAVFYGLIYLPIVFCPFLVVCVLGRDGSNPTLDSIAGLYRRSPVLAGLLLVGMFGLAGIPPTPGFAGKWFLFAAALEAGMFWLVLVGAVNATISLYYYLKIVKAAYLPAPPAGDTDTDRTAGPGNSIDGDTDAGATEVVVGPAALVAAVLAVVLVAALGFYPSPLWEAATEAARSVLGG